MLLRKGKGNSIISVLRGKREEEVDKGAKEGGLGPTLSFPPPSASPPTTCYLFVKAEDVVCLREAIWRAGGAEVAERGAGAGGRAVVGEITGPTGASDGGDFSYRRGEVLVQVLLQCFPDNKYSRIER